MSSDKEVLKFDFFGVFGKHKYKIQHTKISPSVKKHIFPSGIVFYAENLKSYSSENILILGDIFFKDNNQRLCSDLKIIDSSKSFQDISNLYWGNYIIFKFNYIKNQLEIFKSLASKMDMFWVFEKEDNFYFADNITVLNEIFQICLSFNQSYMVSYLLKSENIGRYVDSPFDGISRLPQGCSLSVEKNSSYAQINLITDLTKIEYDDTITLHSEIISQKLMGILSTLVQGTHNVGLKFSGGLDSSSIIYLLNLVTQESTKIHAFNLLHKNIASSDEYVHAKKIADCLKKVDLIKVYYDDAIAFSPVQEHKKLNLPSANIIGLKLNSHISLLAQKLGIDLLVSGEGGDQLFQAPPSPEFLSDLIIDKSYSLLPDKTRELGTQLRLPLLSIAQSCFRGLRQYYFRTGYLDNSDARPSYIDGVTWLKDGICVNKKLKYSPIYDIRDVRPGKFMQIDNIYQILSSICGGLYSDMLYPFLTEPIIELCLKIPTYMLYQNGYDRYIFRKSMSNFLGVNSLWRKEKGEITGVSQLGIKANINFLVDLLMNGYIATHNMVNKDTLVQELIAVGQGATFKPELQNLLSLELFAKQYKS